MAERYFPNKLQKGDTVRVIAPSWSLSIIREEVKQRAEQTLSDMGLTVSYSNHVEETGFFQSASVQSRVDDLHDAFCDPTVKGVLTVIGGWHVNQLFQYMDWDLIQSNPKIFCGFSDIDSLNNAIFAKTRMVTYSGPHFIFFGQKHGFEYTKRYFEKAVMHDTPFSIEPSNQWSDDDWAAHQENRHFFQNQGLTVFQEGEAKGMIISSNLSALSVLQGTDYFPPIGDTVLFIEETKLSIPSVFDRNLQSLVQQKNFHIRGLVIGRFQQGAMADDELRFILASKKELKGIPIILNADFGHTDPKITIPVGGEAVLRAYHDNPQIIITRH